MLSSLKVGRLVPIVIDIDAITILGNCAACGEIVEEGETAVLDWLDTLVIHKRNNGVSGAQKTNYYTGCIPLYIAHYIIANPQASIKDTMHAFGVSRPTIMRCRRLALAEALC